MHCPYVCSAHCAPTYFHGALKVTQSGSCAFRHVAKRITGLIKINRANRRDQEPRCTNTSPWLTERCCIHWTVERWLMLQVWTVKTDWNRWNYLNWSWTQVKLITHSLFPATFPPQTQTTQRQWQTFLLLRSHVADVVWHCAGWCPSFKQQNTEWT